MVGRVHDLHGTFLR